MSNYNSKDEQVMNRQLKVQRMSIPFSIVGNATPASVIQRSDEPSLLFMKTEGVDNILPALSPEDAVPSYGNAANDATGVFNIMVKIGQTVAKVTNARVSRRGATIATAGPQVVSLATASGIVQLTAGGNSDKIVLSCDTDVALNAANTADLSLELEYVIAD